MNIEVNNMFCLFYPFCKESHHTKKLCKFNFLSCKIYIKFIKDKKRQSKVIGMRYRFFCRYNGIDYKLCFNNENGMCKTVYFEFPIDLLHKFDGKNVIKCLCG